MDNKFMKILLKIVRIILPAVALYLSFLPGSYRIPVKETEESILVVDHIYTNFVDPMVRETGNWLPIISVALCVVAVVLAVICAFRENEKNLTWLVNVLSFSMIADLATTVFLNLTPIAWAIAGILLVAVILTAWQEIRLEKKNKR